MRDSIARRDSGRLSVLDTLNASLSSSQLVLVDVFDRVVDPKEDHSASSGGDDLAGPPAHLKLWSMKPRHRRQSLAICLSPLLGTSLFLWEVWIRFCGRSDLCTERQIWNYLSDFKGTLKPITFSNNLSGM